MALSDTFVRKVKWTGAKAGDKHGDGDGMYLHVLPSGKYWRMNYRFGGKQKTLAIGVYPAVPLAAARRAREQARAMLAQGVDPSAAKQKAERQALAETESSFERVAREWLATSASERGEKTQKRVVSWFERDVFPFIGQRPIDSLRAPDILEIMQRMQKRGVIDSMRRVLGYLSKVFRLGMLKELVDRDPTVGVGDALEKRKEGHFAAITEPKKVGDLLRAIWGYDGHLVTRAALKIAPLVFQRPHMLREMEWAEVDLDNAEWRIPAEKMKMENDHIVPLARQVIEILLELQPVTGHSRWVFAGHRPGRAMSDNTINSALRTLGYDSDSMVGHGFRAMARTILDEVLGERVDLIEHQLGHAVKDVNGRAYNRTTHLPARRTMMQRWADYLESLRLGSKTTTNGEAV